MRKVQRGALSAARGGQAVPAVSLDRAIARAVFLNAG